MLLKHPRQGSVGKFVRGTAAQRTAMNLRSEQVKGVYDPKERRMAKKMEV
jgi:hypothetical protein|tara:strand:- start:572 stop:721 length:150 start_codon:yes stop_codon:yes gene_type:complete